MCRPPKATEAVVPKKKKLQKQVICDVPIISYTIIRFLDKRHFRNTIYYSNQSTIPQLHRNHHRTKSGYVVVHVNSPYSTTDLVDH
jgi:hypothetical protein